MSVRADDDGVVRRVSPLHVAHGDILPSLALGALLAAEPGAAPSVSAGELRVGTRAWPVTSDGSILLRFPRNADALSIVSFSELIDAADGRPGKEHIGDLVQDKIVFVGSSTAVLGDFALTPVGRLPGLQINALITEMLIENQTRRPAAWWIDLLLLALALALPVAMVMREAPARPREIVLGLPAIVAVIAGAGMALFALNQHSHWLFAALAGAAAQACALVVALFTLHRERQRLFYEKMAAQQASRMKSEFLAHMTHELRTPVTAIMGFNKINQLTDDLGREQRIRNSDIISRNCNHLLALVNNNLDLARIEAGQLSIERKPEDIAGLLEEVTSTLRGLAEQKGLALQLSVVGSLPAALSLDGFRLRQVLMNLIGNAVKFTERGTVTLEARWRDGELEAQVHDTGPGIPADSLERVFEPFERATTSPIVGTGLGLAITRKLVLLMGGRIVARSAVNEGSTFEVRIPAAEIEAPAPQPIAAPAAAQSQLSGTVLVAEDNESLRDLIEMQLRELGVRCRLVSNGLDAVAAATADRYDLVLMDMDMPLMDGYEAVNVLRGRGYDRPIIAFTAYRDGPAVERAVREGCNAVVSKPVSIEGLRSALEPLLCQ
jgi:signal transduction histidine kinase/CheY-like chemotaxis protein